MHSVTQNPLETTPWLQSALGYAANGWPVLPLYSTDGATCSCPKGANCGANAGKHPRTFNGLTAATTDPEQIRRWAEQWPESNLGVALPKGTAAIDVDPRNGGGASMTALEEKFGPLPSACSAATGGGGLHILVKLASDDDVLPGRLGPGIDIKQAGGYIVAFPSVHASGKQYRWIDTSLPEPAPAWLQAKTHKRGTQQRSSGAVSCNLLEPVWSPEVHEKLAAMIEPYFVPGAKHPIAFGLGGWIQQQGGSSGDAAEIVARLPSADPDKRIKDALDAYTRYGDSTYGFRYLVEHGGVPAEVIDTWRDACPKAFSGTMPEGFEWSKTEAASPAGDSPPRPARGVLGTWKLADVQLKSYRRLTAAGCPIELARGCATAVQASPGRGKTPILNQTAFELDRGGELYGYQCEKCRVLYITWEKPEGLKHRALSVAKKIGAEDNGVMYATAYAPLTSKNVAEFAAAAAEYDVLIIDTLNKALGAADTNEQAAAVPLDELILSLPDTAILVAAYERKSAANSDNEGLDALAGSTSIGGSFESGVRIVLTSKKDEYVLKNTRKLSDPPDEITIRTAGSDDAIAFERVSDTIVALTNQKRGPKTKSDYTTQALKKIREELDASDETVFWKPDLFKTALLDRTNSTQRDALTAAIKALVTDGVLVPHGSKNNAPVYRKPYAKERENPLKTIKESDAKMRQAPVVEYLEQPPPVGNEPPRVPLAVPVVPGLEHIGSTPTRLPTDGEPIAARARVARPADGA